MKFSFKEAAMCVLVFGLVIVSWVVGAVQMPAGIYDWMTVEVIPEVHYVLSGTPASKTVFWKNRDADFGHATTDKETGAITIRRYYTKE